jgi:N-acetylglucosaminyldiphosphoundecaprenol N-acetyl-beta-D-mannosaminyltransferase
MDNNAGFTIFGVHIDNYTCEEIDAVVNQFLRNRGQYQIATINPEFLLSARRDHTFRKVLNASTLRVVDGHGISFVAWLQKQKIRCRYPGADLLHLILRYAVDVYDMPIYILARKDGLSSWKTVRASLLRQYPHAKITGQDANIHDLVTIDVERCVVLCNFGAPYQEVTLNAIVKRSLHTHIIAMGVGGSFDYITGNLQRAPVWIRRIGMEWLYRLFQQPRRWRRIINAVIIFPIMVVCNQEK